ncbi:Pentatricopeptide repeat-containing protein [Thalictrum thalictroides]|uniref:Pentatricopeptide repeat-containing protein n=1 Tax=Thalictrum thalictroides TaxID=46969 RepID=A0A7J6VMD6_THATH|nr:Pentatricopeptide repeat-containing protein [Thalictrum thalictroides]
MYNEALHLFERLKFFPYLKPDNFTYPSVLKACGALGIAKEGKKVHTQVIKSGFDFDVVVISSVVGMYAKCNLFDLAICLFDEMPERDVPSWNTVMSCYYQGGKLEKALELFETMKSSGFEPDSVTFTTVFSACTRLSDLDRGKRIHEGLVGTGFEMDGYVSSALVDMYGKCGCLDMAKMVFEQIPRKSVVSWNSMICGYSLKGDSYSCLQLFRRMNEERVRPTSTTLSSLLTACSRSAKLREGKFIHGYIIRNRIKSDIFIYSSLIDLYFKCGSVVSAEHIFKRMPKTNVVSWNVMISGYVTVGCYIEALSIFSDMKDGNVTPDAVTFTSVLPVCSQLAALEQGREIHYRIIENGLEYNEIVMGALLDMYAKCGAVDEARCVFDQLPERDFVSWTSMITAYGSHGQAIEALELFQKMVQSKAKPDRVTFLAVISACSHAGLVDEGCHYFNVMTDKYGIRPTLEHYSCLIDLLGRAGRLSEAYGILQSNPTIHDDAGLLSTLLSACNMHKNLHLGEEIARLLMKKDPDDPAAYIALSNLCASVGKWREVGKIRIKMKELGLKKNPGCSWTEVENRLHLFFVEDRSHPEVDIIYECLANFMRHVEKDETLSWEEMEQLDELA